MRNGRRFTVAWMVEITMLKTNKKVTAFYKIRTYDIAKYASIRYNKLNFLENKGNVEKAARKEGTDAG